MVKESLQDNFHQNSFSLEWTNLSLKRFVLLLKCLFIINSLSDHAIEEALEDCDRIIDFYGKDLTRTSVKTLPSYQSPIKATVLPTQIRPSLVLDNF